MNSLQKQIYALLFWKNEPTSLKNLAQTLKVTEQEIQETLQTLSELIKDQGVVIVQEGDTVTLATHKETAPLIESLEKLELSKELSKSALETLSIVLYKGPIRRSEIDYIRGVNSQFILRHLEIRGLVEKAPSLEDARVFLYGPTLELLAFLGITKRDELPEFDALTKLAETFVKTEQKEESEKVNE